MARIAYFVPRGSQTGAGRRDATPAEAAAVRQGAGRGCERSGVLPAGSGGSSGGGAVAGPVRWPTGIINPHAVVVSSITGALISPYGGPAPPAVPAVAVPPLAAPLAAPPVPVLPPAIQAPPAVVPLAVPPPALPAPAAIPTNPPCPSHPFVVVSNGRLRGIIEAAGSPPAGSNITQADWDRKWKSVCDAYGKAHKDCGGRATIPAAIADGTIRAKVIAKLT